MDAPPSRRSKRLSRKHEDDRCLTKPNYGDLLSTEVWLMIFEELSYDLPYELRLVSKRFNIIATPVLFRNYSLNDKIIASRPDPLTSRVVEIVKAHTRAFSICRKMNWYRVTKFLSDCSAFQDLRWLGFSKEMRSLPTLIQTAFRHDWPNVRLHFSTMYSDETHNEPFSPESFSESNLYRLELDNSLNLDKGEMDKLNALVASSKGLRHLAINRWLRFATSHGRLPAIKTLKLSGDCWPYQCAEIPAIWDFSRLTSLSFNWANVRSFADSVPKHSLSALTELSVREEGFDFLSEQISASEALADFIAKLEGLQVIRMDTSFPTKSVHSLTKHGNTLKVLRISNARQGEEWLAPRHIKALLVSCLHLVELSLDFELPLNPGPLDNVESYELDFAKEGLKHIAGFRNLRRLTINYKVDDECQAKFLHRNGFCAAVERYLSRKKRGVHLETLSLSLETPTFDFDPDFEYSADYEWDAEGELVHFDEYNLDEDSDDSSGDGDDTDDSD